MADDTQRYRDWLMQKGMTEYLNEAAARHAQRHGLPAPAVQLPPPPPPGCTEDLELKAIARKARAKERAAAKKRGEKLAPLRAKKPIPLPVREPEPPRPPTIGRPRPRAA